MSANHKKMRHIVDANEQSEGPIYFGWCMLPSRETAQIVAQSGFDAVLVDMQHGAIDFADACNMTAAIAQEGKAPLVRIPVGDFATASRALDFGAQMIIAPMINTADEAKDLVKAVKYTPLGERSFGPFQACRLYNIPAMFDYVAEGNTNCLVLAMIETQQALDNLEDILGTGGIDGVFVGPADLSLALLEGKAVNFDHELAVSAFQKVLSAAAKHGKMTGIYATDTHYAKLFAQYGFQMIAVASEAGFLVQGVNHALAELDQI